MISATVSGNLGKDAETRNAGSGTVTNFSVASTARVKGEKVTTWVRCALWGKRGESLQRYLTKGTRLAVSGSLSTREHDGKTYLELEAHDVDLLGGGERDREPAARPAAKPARGGYDDRDYGMGSGAEAEADAENDDIPF